MDKPEKGSAWCHVATGDVYTVLGIATGQQSTMASTGYCVGPDCLEQLQMVVYERNRDGLWAVRHLEEFLDGRFTQVTT